MTYDIKVCFFVYLSKPTFLHDVESVVVRTLNFTGIKHPAMRP